MDHYTHLRIEDTRAALKALGMADVKNPEAHTTELRKTGTDSSDAGVQHRSQYLMRRTPLKVAERSDNVEQENGPKSKRGSTRRPAQNLGFGCELPHVAERGEEEKMERATGLEPATSSLGSWCSTVELRPPVDNAETV